MSKIYLKFHAGNRRNIYILHFHLFFLKNLFSSVRVADTTIWRIKGEDEGPPFIRGNEITQRRREITSMVSWMGRL